MGISCLIGRGTGGRQDALSRVVIYLASSSLLLYLLATYMQRVWALLNSDIGALFRRL